MPTCLFCSISAGDIPCTEVFADDDFLAFRDTTLVTPDSGSVLPSITRRSLLEIARRLFDWKTEERPIALEELADMEAAACCGTAAVLTWIQEISDGDQVWQFPFDERWQQLYDALVGIQTATIDDPFGQRHEITK